MITLKILEAWPAVPEALGSWGHRAPGRLAPGWGREKHMEVSWNGGTPIHHPFVDGIFPIQHVFWGSPIYGTPHMFYLVHNMVIYEHHGVLANKSVSCFGEQQSVM